MKHFIAGAIACLVLTSFAAATQPEWVTFSAPGRFSLQFPKQPTLEVQDVDTSIGKMTAYTYTTSSSTVTYMASLADFLTVPRADQQQRTLDTIRDSIANTLEAKIVQETKISIDGNPGREFRISKTTENGAELIIHWRIYLVRMTLYRLAASYYKRDSQSPELQKYFDSFQLLK